MVQVTVAPVLDVICTLGSQLEVVPPVAVKGTGKWHPGSQLIFWHEAFSCGPVTDTLGAGVTDTVFVAVLLQPVPRVAVTV